MKIGSWKKYTLSFLISLILTFAFAIVFRNVFYQEDMLYAFDDYSFLQADTTNTQYSELQLKDISEVIKSSGYAVTGNTFKAIEPDPNIIYSKINKGINKVRISFLQPLENKLSITAYYRSTDEEFSQSQSSNLELEKGLKNGEITFPSQDISSLRIDIGEESGIQFELDKIEVLNGKVNYTSFQHVLILEFVFFLCYFIMLKLLWPVRKGEKEGIIKHLNNNKELILYLAKVDFKNKFAGSFFGIIWGFIQPIVTLLLYWFVFQVGLRSGGIREVPFVLWLMAGLVPWFYFQEAFTSATNCFIEYSYLVKKVVFNIDILPIVKTVSSLFVHVFFVLVMIVFYTIYGLYPGISIIQLAYYTICMIALVISLSYFTSAVSIFFKDMTQVISIMMQIGTWMTPILWDISAISGKLQWIFKLNPMYYVVEGYRDTLISGGYFWNNMNGTIYFWAFVIVVGIIAKKMYTKLKPHFSDVL